jgi:hypothetical protein
VVMDLMKLAVPQILQVWLCTELGKGVVCLVQVNEVLTVPAYQGVCTRVHTCAHNHTPTPTPTCMRIFKIDPLHCHEALRYETCHSAIKNMCIKQSSERSSEIVYIEMVESVFPCLE